MRPVNIAWSCRYQLNAPDICYWLPAARGSFDTIIRVPFSLSLLLAWISALQLERLPLLGGSCQRQLGFEKMGHWYASQLQREGVMGVRISGVCHRCMMFSLWYWLFLCWLKLVWSCRYAARIWMVSLARFVKIAQRMRGAQEQLPSRHLWFWCFSFHFWFCSLTWSSRPLVLGRTKIPWYFFARNGDTSRSPSIGLGLIPVILHGGSLCVQDHFVREVLACEVPFQREQPACSQSFFLWVEYFNTTILGEDIEFAGKHPWLNDPKVWTFQPWLA